MTLGLGDLAFLGSLQPSSTLLLDLYPNAAAAYSLRQLRTGVTNVVRLQRSSDLVEADFTAAQVANGEMATWVGVGNNGYVRTWYDQSGNGRNAGIAANPLGDLFLVENGIVVSQNGKPAIRNKFSNVLATSFQLSFPFSALFVLYPDYETLSTSVRFAGHSSNGQMRYASNSLGGFFGASLSGPAAAGKTQQLLAYISSGNSSISTAVNNSALTANTGAFSISASGFHLFGLSGGSMNGSMQEVIIYPRDISADFAQIKLGLNSYYSIY